MPFKYCSEVPRSRPDGFLAWFFAKDKGGGPRGVCIFFSCPAGRAPFVVRGGTRHQGRPDRGEVEKGRGREASEARTKGKEKGRGEVGGGKAVRGRPSSVVREAGSPGDGVRKRGGQGVTVGSSVLLWGADVLAALTTCRALSSASGSTTFPPSSPPRSFSLQALDEPRGLGPAQPEMRWDQTRNLRRNTRCQNKQGPLVYRLREGIHNAICHHSARGFFC